MQKQMSKTEVQMQLEVNKNRANDFLKESRTHYTTRFNLDSDMLTRRTRSLVSQAKVHQVNQSEDIARAKYSMESQKDKLDKIRALAENAEIQNLDFIKDESIKQAIRKSF